MTHATPSCDAAPALLAVRALAFAREGRTLFEALSFDARPGEVTALIGPNGAGKSTLLSLLAGLDRPSAGTIHFEGVALDAWPRRALAQRLALLAQEAEVELPYTVRELVLMGRAPHQDALGRVRARDEEVLCHALDEVGLAHLAQRPIGALSGGERRRALLAQALAQSPRLLLLDEPTAFLDLRYQALFWEVVARRVAGGLAVIAVLHDPNLAAAWADQVVTLSGDGACQVGSAAQLLTREHLEALYGTRLRLTPDDGTGARFFALDTRRRAAGTPREP